MGTEVMRFWGGVVGVLVFMVTAVAVPFPARAALGDSWPLTPETSPVSIDGSGLYGSSGNQIFQFTGAEGRMTTRLTAQTAAGAPAHWAANLGLGPDTEGRLRFVGSFANNAHPQLYGLRDGQSAITEIGSAPQAATAWGGLSVAPSGVIWQGTNLQSTGDTRLSSFDPRTGQGAVGGLSPPPRPVTCSGTVAASWFPTTRLTEKATFSV